VAEGFSDRSELEEFLSSIQVKLYDFEEGKCVLMVRLEDYVEVKDLLSEGRIRSVTSSGKIRLVRERMKFSRKPRKR